MELGLNCLEDPDQVPIKTVTQNPTKSNPENPQPTTQHCRKPGHYRSHWCELRGEKGEGEANKNSTGKNDSNNNSGQKKLTQPTEVPTRATLATQTQTADMTENRELTTPAGRLLTKPTTPERNTDWQPMLQMISLFGIKDRWDRVRINNKTHRTKPTKVTRLRPRH